MSSVSRRKQAVTMALLWVIVICAGVPLSDNFKPWGAWLAYLAGILLLFWLLRFRASSRKRRSDINSN